MDECNEFDKALSELVAAARAMAEKWGEGLSELCEALVPACAAAREALESIAALAVGVAELPPPRKKDHRKPPRYAGPQNKGRTWTQQPPRLARSDCRKMRR